MTPTNLYKFLLAEQARINTALDEIKERPEAEILSGQWTMTHTIIEKFGLETGGGGISEGLDA